MAEAGGWVCWVLTLEPSGDRSIQQNLNCVLMGSQNVYMYVYISIPCIAMLGLGVEMDGGWGLRELCGRCNPHACGHGELPTEGRRNECVCVHVDRILHILFKCLQ